MQSQCIVIQTSCENAQVAQAIQNALITEKQAACIQAQEIKSTYLWQGKVESSTEIKLEIKTKASLFEQVAETIRQLSTYDCPEIIALPIIDCNQAYLDWIIESTTQNERKV